MITGTLYEDRHFRVIFDNESVILNFVLPNKSYRFSRLEVESLISKSRPELEIALNSKIEDARLLLIDQGLNYDSVGFVLAQAYARHGDLLREANIPRHHSNR